MDAESIAKVCYAAHSMYAQTFGNPPHGPWDELSDEYRGSVIQGVQLYLDNPDMTVQAAWKATLAEKAVEGWKCGPRLNPDKKEDPSLVPYEEHSAYAIRSANLFRAIITALSPPLDESELSLRRARRGE